MTDQLDDRLRSWAHDLDNAIADARTDHEPYVDLGLPRRRSRTGLVAMAAAACLLIGSLAVVATMVSTGPDDDTPVASEDGSERPPSNSAIIPPESLEPVITDATPAVGSSFVTTEDGDRIGLVLADEGGSMDVCVRSGPADESSTGGVCTSRRVPGPLVGGVMEPGGVEVGIIGAVGANGTTVRARYANGDTVSVETLGLPDMGGARVFALKLPVDTPPESVVVLSQSGDVLARIETDAIFRLAQLHGPEPSEP